VLITILVSLDVKEPLALRGSRSVVEAERAKDHRPAPSYEKRDQYNLK